MSLKVLFIGGTGIISSACSALAVEKGFDLYLLNRGNTVSRPVPEGATVLRGDIRDPASARNALEGRRFDAVVNWIAFTPDQIESDLELFRSRTGQYVFISSASAYQTPPASLPVTESTVLANPVWEYSRNKIACEERLVRAYREERFPATIVRPSHTYDRTLLPMHGGYTVIDRMRRGKPVVVHGDGTSLWTMTHHRDFAKGFVGLLGNHHAIGEAFHITSDEVSTWDQIHRIFADAAGAPPPTLVHVPSEVIAAYDSRWGDSLLGDKTHSMVFDNRKIKRFVPDFAATIPLSWGAKEVMAWYDADPARQVVDPRMDALMDTLIEAQKRALPSTGN
ncbi:MAG TPA: SDR family oxidoreductase [Chthonomonadaceae bacterium]|nr:SDR family oxidoreductase [Chthonomonadaceae bacterium]